MNVNTSTYGNSVNPEFEIKALLSEKSTHPHISICASPSSHLL